ncbi:MAG: hypothetical protein IID39_02650 [Planctomycetes bacterium]|nr:hypothetical protein [Planctomycetota bacterium]
MYRSFNNRLSNGQQLRTTITHRSSAGLPLWLATAVVLFFGFSYAAPAAYGQVTDCTGQANGTPCDPTSTDFCAATCSGGAGTGAAVDCSDGNVCTDDGCNPAER